MAQDERLREALLELQILREREARTLAETRTLLECLEAYSSAGSAAAAIVSIFTSLKDKIGAGLSLILTREDTGAFTVASSADPSLRQQRVSPPFDPCARVRAIRDLAALGPWPKGFDLSPYNGLIVVPLSANAALLAFSTKSHSFRKEDTGLVKRLAGLAAEAMRNAQMAAENELLAATIAGSSAGIAISDATRPDHPLIYINKAFEDLTGYGSGESLGKNCRFLSAETPGSEERLRLRQAVKDATPGTFLLQNRRKTGELFWNELTIYPVYDAQNQLRNLVATQSDVTDRVEVEMREQNLSRELMRLQRQETISQLTAGVAHDFNNLLAVVNGSATLIGMQPDLSSDLRQHVDRISLAGAQSAKLISRLLDVGAEAEADGVFELASLLADLPSLVQASMPRAVELEIQGQAPGLLLRGDLGMLSQILINLILNACDAFEGGEGHIQVAAKTLKSMDRQSLNVGELFAGREYAQIQVKDDGTGMSAATAAQIFQPYFTTKGRSGTGLGLATAALQLRALGGGMAVDSSLGNGTTFTLYWPLATQPAEAPEHPEASDINLKGMTVIVVDDDPNVGATIAAYLDALGAEVATCERAIDAAEAMEEDPEAWSAIITDYDMPEMNGGALVERVRHVAPDVPIYVVTALAKRLTDPRLNDGQVNKILPKPINLARLAKALAADWPGQGSA